MIRASAWISTAILLFAASLTHANEKATGAQLYQRCAACHLDTGQGAAGMFPPLTSRFGPMAATQAGRDYLAMVVEVGLTGPIRVDGVPYQGIMPAQGPGLGDDGVATVLNYILESFNKETLPKDWRRFTQEEVAEIKSRHPNATGQTVHAQRHLILAERARFHWVMHCQGCHGIDAQGTPGGAPRMAGTVSQFLRSEDGRGYLARVPGVAFVSLSHRDVAELLNWVVQRFDGEHLPTPFVPYSEDEIEAFRRQPLVSRAYQERQRILQSLR